MTFYSGLRLREDSAPIRQRAHRRLRYFRHKDVWTRKLSSFGFQLKWMEKRGPEKHRKSKGRRLPTVPLREKEFQQEKLRWHEGEKERERGNERERERMKEREREEDER